MDAGVNTTADLLVHPRNYVDTPVRSVRLVLNAAFDQARTVAEWRAAGFAVDLIMAAESRWFDGRLLSWEDAAAEHARRVGPQKPRSCAGGNEIDAVGDSSMGRNAPDGSFDQQYTNDLTTRLVDAVDRAFSPHGVEVWGPAQSSGIPFRWAAIPDATRRRVVAVDFHPYTKQARRGQPWPGWGNAHDDTIEDLGAGYRALLFPHQKLVCTELGARVTDFIHAGTDFPQMELLQAQYLTQGMEALAHLGVAVAHWFCASDLMVAGYGTLDPKWRQRPSYVALGAAAARFRNAPGGSGGDPVPDGQGNETWAEAKERVEQQIAFLVENQRRMLKGDWDEARIFLDAIDPKMAGHWTNVQFPKG